ncbi:pyridoxamine 5'-phosphate oxidase family protein [Mycobacterium sp. KBS0706]|uniref:pyridoxamine 5'-phosphate oxidase family protein n=1 Tax=Mycobacterium sp. KBS0706 TaxID=2578109 RepID=UPI00110FE7DF|nr:pyridoxamine 5'-phosphate oxidase family protein [Mycobacterium sp. KBS0706]TSD85161.1 pyridoxamine 5'-phosphate oxidase family protein [Mycobacterium sp. KBS0706]
MGEAAGRHDQSIQDQDSLRDLYPEPRAMIRDKILDRIDPHARAFIGLSPFLVIATAGADGSADASPRGDAPGFVTVADGNTLLIPDRRGNNLCDSLSNVLENPRVGLVFFVPGINETLRVNGGAAITTDPALLEPMAVEGKVPASALRVTVEELYFHCGKALIRSRLWDPAAQIERSSFPTLGKILADQIKGLDSDEVQSGLETAYRDRLY